MTDLHEHTQKISSQYLYFRRIYKGMSCLSQNVTDTHTLPKIILDYLENLFLKLQYKTYLPFQKSSVYHDFFKCKYYCNQNQNLRNLWMELKTCAFEIALISETNCLNQWLQFSNLYEEKPWIDRLLLIEILTMFRFWPLWSLHKFTKYEAKICYL